MKNLLVVVALGALAWYGHEKQNATRFSVVDRSALAEVRGSHASQPTPDTVKMDGDGDGVPCERQWCR